ncbi:hypothetical protein SAMN04515678_11435 [Roseivivax sediminis]|uniref:Uncharacterized protein n=1 Tax=Roseivivax sediminis TaxID=936889 RepID=A0A1I2CQ83_9RHOB|nr:hypothetical protein SAMN04515678_11435 [Roseivivax sediminis]
MFAVILVNIDDRINLMYLLDVSEIDFLRTFRIS